MTNLATPPFEARPTEIDALEAAYRMPAYDRAGTSSGDAPDVGSASSFGGLLVLALFALLALGGIALLAITLTA